MNTGHKLLSDLMLLFASIVAIGALVMKIVGHMSIDGMIYANTTVAVLLLWHLVMKP